jgi:hypothetical protein
MPFSIERNFRRDERGSFTLEASVVMPLILTQTFLVLFFAVWIAQGVMVDYGASVAAERTAFNWNNSAKAYRTGEAPSGSGDRLYWRMLDDGMLARLFGWASSAEEAVAFPDAERSSDGPLTLRKLSRTAARIPSPMRGEIGYRNDVWRRVVSVRAELPAFDPLLRFRGQSPADVAWSALVVEPPEFMRTYGLIRDYADRVRQSGGQDRSYLDQAAEVLKKWERVRGS